jgi:nucleoside-diphosphate-sugar epimerase
MRAETIDGVVALEDAVLGEPAFEGMVLRYGRFYGPGAGTETPAGDGLPYVHVDAAAAAALLAVDRGAAGLYNVAEPSAYLSSDKARRELGWDPAFRIPPA